MNIRCGSCSLVHDSKKSECPNCGFPNRMFEEPEKSPIEIVVEISLARAMEEHAANTGKELNYVWQTAAEAYLTEYNTARYSRKGGKK